MIWLTWRQFRASAATAAALLAALAAVLALTGPGMADDYAAGVAACKRRPGGCGNFYQDFYHAHMAAFFGVTVVVLLLPALLGLFWGAPLITRELETGTHRLVWNQSVTRTRWLTVKLVLVGLGATAAAGIGSLAVTWWAGPVDGSAARNIPSFPRMGPLLFDARGLVPVAYAAFAFLLGVAAGTVVRRTLPAMAVTLAVFVVVQLALPLLVRPHYAAPVRASRTISEANLDDFFVGRNGEPVQLTVQAQAPGDPDAWVLESRLVDAAGKPTGGTINVSTTSGPCAPEQNAPPGGSRSAQPPEGRSPIAACLAEINRLGYRQRLVYQPSSRYWAFQWAETGIFAVLAAGLAGFCFWTVRRRLS
ncbi:ABC transporter permease [Actinomadura rayongensis]|uniref:ABC transporter permease n=1 Tax=Actinomadura rayongensis TaxID=1429076 RepID=A0A6I4WEM4_9ACTN|nr:ABC transporter permease [Actinomadura rayongensis]MXQ66705.1 ABC transporter permease [Actinomadura rayongensis]